MGNTKRMAMAVAGLAIAGSSVAGGGTTSGSGGSRPAACAAAIDFAYTIHDVRLGRNL